jgi:hydrogenase-4 component B
VTLLLVSLGLALASALVAALLGPAAGERAGFRAATVGTLLACAVGLAGALQALLAGAEGTWALPWTLPFGAVIVGVDPLSAFFALCATAVAGLAALHALRSCDPGRAASSAPPRAGDLPRAARFASLYALTLAAILGVVLARDGVLFLVAWEGMTIASWLLVGHDEARPEARRAAMTYLIASHVGAAALYVLFALLARHAGGFGFEAIAAAGPMAPALAGTAFGLAITGFGTKAAFFPLHVWAPDAYPAAPPPAAALLSGALSKMGIYGLCRALFLLAPAAGPAPATWWGALLVVVGAVTAVWGALNALARRDLKRLVAYSSVENLGIVALGLGLGLLGRAHGLPLLAYLGFAGALLHVLNHGLMKSLLFLLAGDVVAAAGTGTLDRMGGLLRRMPRTAAAFLVGAVAISGLPPGNGFVSEWMILTAGLRGAGGLPGGAATAAVLAVVALGLAGGLAGAAFVKAYGVAFLGAARTPEAEAAKDPGGAAGAAVLAAAALCAFLGLQPALAAILPGRAAAALALAGPEVVASAGGFGGVAVMAATLLALVAGLTWLRARLLRGRAVREGPVWACGYEQVGPRLQYTASGFPEPLTGPLTGAVPRRLDRAGPDGYFPAAAHYLDRMADAAGEQLVVPVVRRFVAALGRIRALQAGRLQLYLLYVLATLVLLLAWELVISP